MRVLLFVIAVGYVAALVDEQTTVAPHDDIRAVTILEAPFMMLKDNHTNMVGNDKYEGFIVDLISEVAERADFHYRLYLVEDGRYGVRRPDGEWTGMVGDLLNEAAEIAVAPLTTTPTRARAIDFSVTFMAVPLTLLVKKGTEINSLEELLEKENYQFGARDGGMVADALQSTPEPPFSELWAEMASFQPSAFFESYEDGIERVLEGNFTIMMDKPAAEFVSHNTACDTDTQLEFFIGDSNASYAFGMGPSLRPEVQTAINDAITTAIADGTMEMLRLKWWKDNCPAAACTARLELLFCVIPLAVALLLNKS